MSGPGKIRILDRQTDALEAQLYNFEIAQDQLKREHEEWLKNNVVPYLKRGGSIVVIGTTSRTATDDFNKRLSQRRIDSVIRFLRKESPNNFKVSFQIAMGEVAAEIAGARNGSEDETFRSVLIAYWSRPVPPPPPLRPKPIPTISRKQGAVIWMEHDEKDKSLDSKPGNVSLKYNQQKAIDKTPPYFKYHQIPASHELIRIFTARSRSDFEVANIASINSIYCHIFYQWGVRKRACHLIHGYWRDGAFNNNWPHLYELPDAYVKQWLDDPRTAIVELDNKLVIRATSPRAYYILGTTLGEPAPPPSFGW